MTNGGDDGLRLTAREWLAARVVVIGGFALAILVAVYFTWAQHEQAQQEAAAAAAVAAQTQAEARAAAGPTSAQIAQARTELLVCLRIVTNAATSGIVPNYSKLVNAPPARTDVQGRYTCMAATDVARYKVTADLICSDMRKADCVNLYSVIRDDGTVLYQAK